MDEFDIISRWGSRFLNEIVSVTRLGNLRGEADNVVSADAAIRRECSPIVRAYSFKVLSVSSI